MAVNGEEAVAAFIEAAESEEPFDLVCLDIMMPVMDGQQALEAIRGIERQKGIAPEQGVKIVMTTAVADMANVAGAFAGLCNSYLLKPIRKEALREELKELGLAACAA